MSFQFQLPQLDERAKWSVAIRNMSDAELVLEHSPDTVLQTASIGKIFLLLAVAEAAQNGELNFSDRIVIPAEYQVADSGLLYLMRDQQLTVHDAALLVGAVSDNLATNALIYRLGLERVRDVAQRLGCKNTQLLDYLRNERGPEMPWTPSFGTAAELSYVMRMLHLGTAITPEISSQVMQWLAADTDTSMLADAFLLDPLAHIDPEYQKIVLRHKTGSTEFARIDVGVVSGPAGSYSYAVGANWHGSTIDLRAPVITAMREIGEQLRYAVTGKARDDHPFDN